MFRITIKRDHGAEIWELEGKLTGAWVEELQRCWSERPATSQECLQVHLKAVSYVDAAGKALLKNMHGAGVQIQGCGCMSKAVVEEIVGRVNSN